MVLIYLGCRCDLNLKLRNFEAGRNFGNQSLIWPEASSLTLYGESDWELSGRTFISYTCCVWTKAKQTNQTQNWKVQWWSSPGHPQCGMSYPACMMAGNPTVSWTHVMSSLLTEISHFCLPECLLRVDTSLMLWSTQSFCLALPYRVP